MPSGLDVHVWNFGDLGWAQHQHHDGADDNEGCGDGHEVKIEYLYELATLEAVAVLVLVLLQCLFPLGIISGLSLGLLDTIAGDDVTCVREAPDQSHNKPRNEISNDDQREESEDLVLEVA